jgi:hypothetical protein
MRLPTRPALDTHDGVTGGTKGVSGQSMLVSDLTRWSEAPSLSAQYEQPNST